MMIGTTPRFMKKVLQTALVWTVYEELVPAMLKAEIFLKSVRGRSS